MDRSYGIWIRATVQSHGSEPRKDRMELLVRDRSRGTEPRNRAVMGGWRARVVSRRRGRTSGLADAELLFARAHGPRSGTLASAVTGKASALSEHVYDRTS